MGEELPELSELLVRGVADAELDAVGAGALAVEGVLVVGVGEWLAAVESILVTTWD